MVCKFLFKITKKKNMKNKVIGKIYKRKINEDKKKLWKNMKINEMFVKVKEIDWIVNWKVKKKIRKENNNNNNKKPTRKMIFLYFW